MVLALARRLLGSEFMAAEAVQEASVAALVGLRRLRSPERFGAWYAGIALNVGRRWLRDVTAFAPLSGDFADCRPGPEEQAEAGEIARRVRHAVAVLAPGQRAAVLAFYWQGLSHAEAAVELGISVGAVKARLHQARSALAPQLAPDINPKKEVPFVADIEEPNWVDVEVSGIGRGAGGEPVVVLRERDGSRRLLIYTGRGEAIALTCSREALEMARPMTHQLAASLVAAAGSTVSEVRITRLAENTFFAEVVVDGPAGRAEVDARPSDGLNLALIAGAPIRVNAGLLEDSEAVAHATWEDFPTGGNELWAEMRERQEELRAFLGEDPTPNSK